MAKLRTTSQTSWFQPHQPPLLHQGRQLAHWTQSPLQLQPAKSPLIANLPDKFNFPSYMQMPMTSLLLPPFFIVQKYSEGWGFFAVSLNFSLHSRGALWMCSEHPGSTTSVPSKQRIRVPLALTHGHNCLEQLPRILPRLRAFFFTLQEHKHQWKLERRGTHANRMSLWQQPTHFLNSR